MHVAIEGCCHGELDAIYASIAKAEREKGFKVDLLLICGDFQALRNPHDFESLAVPQKFRAMGSFHSYYSGNKVAPILTIIIGGNHEASNYMWELYHGGWLAENMYYLGTAGSVLVNGLRISGASGIYKSHDLYKGFFETMPYDRSTMRSIYHIRSYSISKLLLLPPSEQPGSDNLPSSPLTASPSPFPPSPHPSIFLSHDWPLTIASSPSSSNDLNALLRRKPFFAEEIRDSTLGSKPLLEVLRKVKPRWWFAAHLHVKFAAVWRHDVVDGPASSAGSRPAAAPVVEGVAARNPDEIVLDDDEDEGEPLKVYSNPDEIAMDDEEDEVDASLLAVEDKIDATADKVEAVETAEVVADAASAPENPDEIMLDEDEDEEPHQHAHTASDSPSSLPSRPPPPTLLDASATEGPITKFLALDKCLPNKDYLQILSIPTPITTEPSTPPSLTYDPAWLAITRAMHPFLSLSQRQTPLPPPEQLKELVRKEMAWVESEGLGWTEGGDGVGEGKMKIIDVQKFWRTAPTAEEGGGGPAAWYTNPQTVALTEMLKIPNKINPFPAGFIPPPLPWLAGASQDPAPVPTADVAAPAETERTTEEPAAVAEAPVVAAVEEKPSASRGGLSLPPPVGVTEDEISL